MVRVHAKAGPWGRPHAAYPIRPFERTFFTLQKNHLWAKVHWRSVHARVRKRFRKKCQKTRSGVPPEQRTPRQDKKNEKTCNLQKLFLLERARIESCIMRGTLSGRRPRGNHGNVLWKKCVFLKKNVFFLSMLGFCTRAANFGASLRRPNWPCLEYPLLFYKISSKKHPPPCASRFPLSDR